MKEEGKATKEEEGKQLPCACEEKKVKGEGKGGICAHNEHSPQHSKEGGKGLLDYHRLTGPVKTGE